MPDNRDDYEPIIATRPSRKPEREDTQPLWPLALALGGALIVALVLVGWFMSRSSDDDASSTVQTEEVVSEESTEIAPDDLPEVKLDPTPAPPATDSKENVEVAQAPTPSAEPAATAEPAEPAEPAASSEEPAATPESSAEVPTDNAVAPPSSPGTVAMTFTSPDAQVRFEVRGPLDTSPPRTVRAGQVMSLEPGTYRVVASGAQLETLERELTLVAPGNAEYAVELCAEPKRERESLARRIVEERACATTEQCESMFNVLSEYAEQLVNDRDFRTQQCAKWRPEAAADGRWTLDTKCDGATLATTCRIEISQGECVVTEPRRTLRGEACPQAELK